MKFEKKEPEVRIQPFNAHKNPWSRCTCSVCGIPYTDEACKHFDEWGAMTVAWHGQGLSVGYFWDCAKCVYDMQLKSGAMEEKEDE